MSTVKVKQLPDHSASYSSTDPPRGDMQRAIDAAVDFVVENYVVHRSRDLGPGHWGIIASLAVSSNMPQTFQNIHLTLAEELGVKLGPTGLRDALAELESLGLVARLSEPEEVIRRGPKSAMFELTDTGLDALLAAEKFPVLKSA